MNCDVGVAKRSAPLIAVESRSADSLLELAGIRRATVHGGSYARAWSTHSTSKCSRPFWRTRRVGRPRPSYSCSSPLCPGTRARRRRRKKRSSALPSIALRSPRLTGRSLRWWLQQVLSLPLKPSSWDVFDAGDFDRCLRDDRRQKVRRSRSFVQSTVWDLSSMLCRCWGSPTYGLGSSA